MPHVKTTPERFELSDLARYAETVGKGEFAHRPFTLEIDCPADLGTVYVLKDYLETILRQLLSNAGKFTLEGGVWLKIRRERSPQNGADMIVISVSDTGCGIPAEWATWIFEPFKIQKIYPNRAGIGLHMIRTLCQHMGGAVRFVSEVGKGTIFTVTVPAEVQDNDPGITS